MSSFKEKERKEKQTWLKSFGKHIQAARKRKGLSAAGLASELLIDKSNMVRIETGKVNTSIYFVKRVCDVLEINIDEFYKEFRLKNKVE